MYHKCVNVNVFMQGTHTPDQMMIYVYHITVFYHVDFIFVVGFFLSN